LGGSNEQQRFRTGKGGIEGLGDILSGGLSHGDVFLLDGLPGTGKTTIALPLFSSGEVPCRKFRGRT
jgi:circadian clock protein KaiC